MKKAELLAPAGSLGKLKLAIYYGADAVYAGGKAFSLRTYADNFSDEELAEGIAYAHARGKKVYVAANIFARNADLAAMQAHFRFLAEIGADAVLISDPGAFRLCRRTVPALPVHISTQANTCNAEAAAFWAESGAQRIVLARELSLAEIAEIHAQNEGLELEDPTNEPNYDHLLVLGVTPEKAPDEAEYVTMTFEKGIPTSINGEAMKVSDIIRKLNALGGKHGIGIVDIVENRVVGMKSRGVYETPGGTILMEAHQQLEELVLDRATMEVKKDMGNKFAQIVYEGKWFTPLREAIQAFVDVTQEYVTGEVKFKLYKGNIIKAGTTSPYSLYSESLASFTTGDLYDHHDADGFITLFGLPLKVRAMKMAEIAKKQQ